MRLSIVAGKATSLINVAKDVAYVAQKRGHAPRILTYVESPSTLARLSDAVVIVYPSSPLFCAEYMLLYRDLRTHYATPAVYYTMIEGRPRRFHVRPWMTRDVEFVAASKYVRDKLEEAGFRVRAVVYHGLVREAVEEASKMVPTARRHLRARYGDRVVLGVVSHSHPRKGLELLKRAAEILAERRRDFAVHVVANPEAERKLEGAPGVFVDAVFGSRSREEVLAFLGAIDFLVVPSMAEGFCLPLLEANAMGTPAVHCLYPPLTEISDAEANVAFGYERVEYVNTGEGVEYELHVYDPRELADAMERAIDLVLNYPSEYEDRRARAKRVLGRFDAERLYPRLLEMVGA